MLYSYLQGEIIHYYTAWMMLATALHWFSCMTSYRSPHAFPGLPMQRLLFLGLHFPKRDVVHC